MDELDKYTGVTGVVIILVILMLIAIPSRTVPAASKIAPLEWKLLRSGLIVDVDPYCGGLMFELKADGENNYSWVMIGDSKNTNARPARGSYGIFYRAKTKNGYQYKWENKKPETKTKVVLNPIVMKSSWQDVVIGLPPTEKTVLVRYENNITIATAYVNKQGQWKLETDRERISGGRVITTVQEWKEILE